MNPETTEMDSLQCSEDLVCNENNVKKDLTERTKMTSLGIEQEYVQPMSIESVIMRVSSIVSSEIRYGSWFINNIKKDDVESHLNMCGAAIEQFTSEMILPSLVSAGVPDTSKGKYQAILATFLSLREILIQNFDSLLGCKDIDATAKIYSTSVILSALKRFQSNNNYPNLVDAFQNTIQSYDSAHEEFSSTLSNPLITRGVTPTGRTLGPNENKSWMISFNKAREAHPLVKRQRLNEDNWQKLHTWNSVPEPNACSIFFIEQIPYEQMQSDVYDSIQTKINEKGDVLFTEYKENVKRIQENITPPPLPDYLDNTEFDHDVLQIASSSSFSTSEDSAEE